MGSGRFEAASWSSYTTARSYDSKSVDEIFESRDLHEDLDVKGKVRESRDSVDNPNSTPIILALDVTGSMDVVVEELARKSLPTLCTQIYERKPVTDPHICVAGIGDAEAHDRVPFQASQFEADIRIAQHLEKLYLEGGGGGNNHEGYSQAWYFGLNHVVADAFSKGRKGFIFTIGDEEPQFTLYKNHLASVFGDTVTEDIDAKALLDRVSQNFEVFHVVVEQGNYCQYGRKDGVYKAWRELLGQHVIPLSDVSKLAEVIVSVLEVTAAGKASSEVIASWDGTTSVAVAKAINGLTAEKVSSEGLVVL